MVSARGFVGRLDKEPLDVQQAIGSMRTDSRTLMLFAVSSFGLSLFLRAEMMDNGQHR
jgi:hypothetical protein